MSDDDADRPIADDQRDVETGSRAGRTADAVVDFGVVEERIDPLAPAPFEHEPAFRACRLELEPDDLLGPFAFGGFDHERAVGSWHRDRDHACVDQLAQPAHDQLQQTRQIDLGCERIPDLVQRLELLRPALRCLVQPRVLDRHRRLSRQQTDKILVFGIEVDATLLFGQVEVAVGDAAQHDRNAQERAHRRMVRRETNRTRVVAERAKTQRLDIADQHPEDPAPARKSADRLDLLAPDAVRDETLQLVAVAIDDAERGVSRPRQLSRNPHQPLEKLVERQCGAQGDTRTDENPQPVVPIELGLAHPHHYP